MSPYRILIVEDQREVSRLLRTALETLEADFEVVEVPSGEEALLDSTLNPVDMLVSDYRLPGMTGVELMRKVKINQPQAKVILITGQTNPRIRKEVAESGADAFFIKPVSMADFLDAIERHLGLVETLLPPEPIAPVESDVKRTIPELLVGLRQELAAISVLLLNDSGRILARAGDLPDKDSDIPLVSSLLSIYSAGQNISRLLGQEIASSWSVFDGGKYDLIFAPVGFSYAMLAIGEGIAGEARRVHTLAIFGAVRKDIENALGGTSTGPSEPPELPAAQGEGDDLSVIEMEPLFKAAKRKFKSAEVDDFWDEAANSQKAPSDPDKLSYDQAKQLGLTPGDES
jgi:CheY-like chemotaxis protein